MCERGGRGLLDSSFLIPVYSHVHNIHTFHYGNAQTAWAEQVHLTQVALRACPLCSGNITRDARGLDGSVPLRYSVRITMETETTRPGQRHDLHGDEQLIAHYTAVEEEEVPKVTKVRCIHVAVHIVCDEYRMVHHGERLRRSLGGCVLETIPPSQRPRLLMLFSCTCQFYPLAIVSSRLFPCFNFDVLFLGRI